MNVVDSSGWLEYMANGPNAGTFAPAVEDVGRLIVPSITIVEVFRRVYQQRTEAEAVQAVSLMRRGLVVDLDFTLAANAGKLGVENKLPLADSIILATARAYQATLWTQDADFDGLPDVHYFPKK
ncbi:MAG: type II toxin-antitoxin system VapC family toxin [Longimicrobiaceae bacterium]